VTAKTLGEELPQQLSQYGAHLDVVSAAQIQNGGYIDVAAALQALAPGLIDGIRITATTPTGPSASAAIPTTTSRYKVLSRHHRQ
jgi:hypothetical protein